MQPLHRGYPGVVLENLCFLPTHLTFRIPDPRTRAKRDRRARFDYKNPMRAVLKTLDPVVLNYAANVLSQEGIKSVVFDTHSSVMDGSMGFLPRRLMVLNQDFDRARKLLREAVPDQM
jgi:Putative prokaryotic signal transducing protein